MTSARYAKFLCLFFMQSALLIAEIPPEIMKFIVSESNLRFTDIVVSNDIAVVVLSGSEHRHRLTAREIMGEGTDKDILSSYSYVGTVKLSENLWGSYSDLKNPIRLELDETIPSGLKSKMGLTKTGETVIEWLSDDKGTTYTIRRYDVGSGSLEYSVDNLRWDDFFCDFNNGVIYLLRAQQIQCLHENTLVPMSCDSKAEDILKRCLSSDRKRTKFGVLSSYVSLRQDSDKSRWGKATWSLFNLNSGDPAGLIETPEDSELLEFYFPQATHLQYLLAKRPVFSEEKNRSMGMIQIVDCGRSLDYEISVSLEDNVSFWDPINRFVVITRVDRNEMARDMSSVAVEITVWDYGNDRKRSFYLKSSVEVLRRAAGFLP